MGASWKTYWQWFPDGYESLFYFLYLFVTSQDTRIAEDFGTGFEIWAGFTFFVVFYISPWVILLAAILNFIT